MTGQNGITFQLFSLSLSSWSSFVFGLFTLLTFDFVFHLGKNTKNSSTQQTNHFAKKQKTMTIMKNKQIEIHRKEEIEGEPENYNTGSFMRFFAVVIYMPFITQRFTFVGFVGTLLKEWWYVGFYGQKLGTYISRVTH